MYYLQKASNTNVANHLQKTSIEMKEMKEIKKRSDCPISYVLDFFGDKWSFLIIRDLVFKERKFYKDFLNAEEGIATNILSDRLKRLESIGVIKSKVFEELKTQKEYFLTEKGRDLIPILIEVILWSAKYDSNSAVSGSFVYQAKADKKKLISSLYSKLN